jgi:Flp pilus assembly pilin Flp
MFLTHLRERLRKVIVNGQGLAEYALLLGLIGIAIVGIVYVLGRATENTFTGLSCQLQPGGVCNSSVASLYDPSFNGGNWLTPMPTVTPCPAGVTCGPSGGGGGGGGTVATATPNGGGGGTVATATPVSGGGGGGGGTVATATPNGGGSVATNTPVVPATATPAATATPVSTATPVPPSVTTGNIMRERWNGIGGTTIGELRTAINAGDADECTTSTSFEAPTDVADSYGIRMRGLLVPTTSGSYTFWIAGDDNVELLLNANGNSAAGATRIAYHNDWTSPREWTKFSTQQSSAINLTAGQTYYIEALMKEGGGGDNLAVAWRGPGMSSATVIPGSNLSNTGFTCPTGGGTGGTVVVDGVTYATGSLLRAVYTGISGTSISDLTSNARYPGSPNECTNPTRFEAPTDVADDYGQRMFGYLLPTVTGSYTFSIAGDDSVELWLSTTASRANAVRIAFHNSWTNSREWTKFASQTSAAITLTAGRAYYIEALMKEGGGGDNLAVAWQTPANSTRTVIPGSNLSGTGLTCSSGTVVVVPTATPVPPTATPVPPTATPVPSLPLMIYTNSLASGWNNWSWDSTIALTNNSQFNSSDRSIRVRYDQGWAALYLGTSSAITGTYDTLRFWVRGGNYSSPHTIRVVFKNAAGQDTIMATITAVRNTWTQVDIPFGSFALSDFRGVYWQEDTGASRGNFWIDDIELIDR